MRILDVSEVGSFVPAYHNDDYLQRSQLLAVGLAHPFSEIRAGVQSHVTVTADGQVIPSSEGLVYGYRYVRAAVGSVIKQVAYDSGLAPGHAGITSQDRRHYDVVVSGDAKAAFRQRAAEGRYTGYLALVNEAMFDDDDIWTTPGTRVPTDFLAILGVDLASAESVLGGSGLEGLMDPADHPIASQHLKAARLRPEVLGPYTEF